MAAHDCQISCFPDLPTLLEKRFGFKVVDFMRVPGEHGSLHDSAALIQGTHFPEVFETIIEQIGARAEGKVVLIAAGVLGKFYAIAVKRAGGIGLDLGSLIDAWTGRRTRPGYNSQFRLW